MQQFDFLARIFELMESLFTKRKMYITLYILYISIKKLQFKDISRALIFVVISVRITTKALANGHP